MISPDKPLLRCTCSATRMASRAISQLFDKALAPADLRSGQFALLRALARLGPVGVQKLGQALLLDRTTVARTLRPLEREGLVSIAIDSGDRRARLLVLTERGRQRLVQAEPLWTVAQDRLESAFGAEATSALHGALAALIALNLSA